ncbi:MAG: AEC family transporter [Francisellaceae bacterium]
MIAVLATTSVLFFTIFLGFCFGKTRIFSAGSDLTLIHYVFYIALPIQLFLSCYHSRINIFNVNYIGAYFLAMLLIIALTYAISRKMLKLPRSHAILNTMASSQVDGAYFTIPLFLLVFSSAAFAIPLMAIQNIVFFTLSILFIEMSIAGSRQRPGLGFIIKRVVKVLTTNPIIVSSLLGFIIGSLKIDIHEQILSILNFIAKTAAPMALFSLGLTCAFGLSSLKVKREKWLILGLSTLKLLIFPLIALIIGWLLGLSKELLLALVLLTASPTATHNYIIANQYQLEEKTQTFVVIVTTLLSFITINLWLYFI